MKLLAFDTATEACSAALLIDGELRERYQLAPREHARLLLPMIDSLLAEADLALAQLDAIAFGRGPGSFTGLRIAASAAQAIAFAADLPVVPVSTLAALARAALQRPETQQVLAALDARMQEIYWAHYRRQHDNEPELVGTEQVSPAQDVQVDNAEHWHGIGTGWRDYADSLRTQLGERVAVIEADVLPRASHIAFLAVPGLQTGALVSAEEAVPVYLRNQVVQKQT